MESEARRITLPEWLFLEDCDNKDCSMLHFVHTLISSGGKFLSVPHFEVHSADCHQFLSQHFVEWQGSTGFWHGYIQLQGTGVAVKQSVASRNPIVNV